MENYQLPYKKIKNNKTKGGLSTYQYGLLHPSIVNTLKTPATYGKRTIPVKKFWSITRNVNASGHILLHFMPGEILDSSATSAASIICNDATYNPSTASAIIACEFLDSRPLWNLTVNTGKQVRLVAMQISMTSLSTSLNRKGTIYGACLESQAFGNQLYGSLAVQGCAGIPTIQNGLFKRANVSDGQGIAVCHIPSDDDDHTLLPPVSAGSTGGTIIIRHPNADDFRGIVLIGQSLEASSSVRFDFHAHFEIVPTPEQSLSGFETTAFTDNVIPAVQIQDIMNNHRDKIIRTISSFEGGTDNTLGVNNPVEIKLNNKAKNSTNRSNDSNFNKPKVTVKDVQLLKNIVQDVKSIQQPTNMSKPDSGYSAALNAWKFINPSLFALGSVLSGGKRQLNEAKPRRFVQNQNTKNKYDPPQDG
jgi:hypothetical protein